MIKDSLIEKYLQITRNLNNNLKIISYKMEGETLVQLTLNRLSFSYERIIWSLTVLDKLPTFIIISLKFLNESHHLELYKNWLGNKESLVVKFQHNQNYSQYYNLNYKKIHTNWHGDYSLHSCDSYLTKIWVCKSNYGF